MSDNLYDPKIRPSTPLPPLEEFYWNSDSAKWMIRSKRPTTPGAWFYDQHFCEWRKEDVAGDIEPLPGKPVASKVPNGFQPDRPKHRRQTTLKINIRRLSDEGLDVDDVKWDAKSGIFTLVVSHESQQLFQPDAVTEMSDTVGPEMAEMILMQAMDKINRSMLLAILSK